MREELERKERWKKAYFLIRREGKYFEEDDLELFLLINL